ncbi:hypothetical protein [Rickettsia bellii]|uniref:Uncharacterized protein n=1 Tax=Rickettsia bellii str. RML Mogi TaxID=1359194 RepID=A0A0F3QI76_RICBE|nr:hypothetical protein [Rickettsia bellii]KJV92248.1 hypothetical protein RBEMOGI_0876 [Rickettsia bellii str. RML Mogi]
MFNTTTGMVTVTAALSNIKTNTKIHNNGSAIVNSTTTHFNHTLSTSYHPQEH